MFLPELNLQVLRNIVGYLAKNTTVSDYTYIVLIVMVERTLNVSIKVAFVISHRHLDLSDFSRTMFLPELNLQVLRNIVGYLAKNTTVSDYTYIVLIVMVERTLNVSIKVAFVISHRHLDLSDFSRTF